MAPELDAFFTEHRRNGELDAGVDGPIVWIACPWRGGNRAGGGGGGATFAQQFAPPTLPPLFAPPCCPGMDRRRFLLTSLGGALAVPLAGEAQPMRTVPLIAILDPGSAPNTGTC